MATSNILGLFTSPEEYQAQQMGAEQQRALGFAQLSPMQLANYNLFMGGQQLGRGFGGLLGVQDPQLQRIRQRQEIMQSINPADPQSLIAGIQRASKMNDPELALSLTDYMNKQGSEMALAAQRTAAAKKEHIQALPAGLQEAARIAEIERELVNLDPNSVEYKARVAEKTRLERSQKMSGQTNEQKNAYALTVAQNPNLAPESPEFQLKFSTNLASLTSKDGAGIKELVVADEIVKLTNIVANKPDTQEAKDAKIKLDLLKGTKKDQNQIKELVVADEIVKLRKLIRDAADPMAADVLEAKDKLSILEPQLKKDKPNLTVVGEVKTGVDKGKAVYVDEINDQQFVYDFDKTGKQIRKPFVGDVDRVTSQTNVSATANMAPGVKSFQEKLGALDAKDVEAARANRDNSIAALNTLNELSRLDKQGVITGAFADGRVGAVNLLNTLGLVGAKDVGILANSQTFSKVAGDLVLATLGGKLGAGFSNEDRKFIAGLVPQLETSRQARQQLISFMAKKNQLIIDEATRLEDYARENNGLKGFKPKIPIINVPIPGSVQAMSDAELQDAIKKAREKKGK